MKRNRKSKSRHKFSHREQQFLERIHLNAAGLDIGSASHFVAVPQDRDPEPVREFKSFTGGLIQLADWLTACEIDTVAMESTGVYWIPLYEILTDRGFEVLLVNAHHVKGVPGRKTDVVDCQWIQQLHTFGLLRASFRPAAQITALRTLVRHRETLVDEAGSYIQRMQKALVLMNLHLHKVLRDITGVTGLAILRDIVGGQTDPKVLSVTAIPAANPPHRTLPPPSRATTVPSTCLSSAKTWNSTTSITTRSAPVTNRYRSASSNLKHQSKLRISHCHQRNRAVGSDLMNPNSTSDHPCSSSLAVRT